jgi:hypothetical protein
MPELAVARRTRHAKVPRGQVAVCKQPMELLAKRDIKRLVAATG